jgi:dual specificity MAP kinase phosphatase
MDIQDINDDGVDSILPHLVAGMDFIQSARAAGGKCLVHCRVGVSRSATVVIGQVMKDLDMSLADAYIMVRARRLNILIQPTVLFMHTLWQWEEQIRNSAIIDPKNGNSHPARSGRMCWPVLATEIANINAKCE